MRKIISKIHCFSGNKSVCISSMNNIGNIKNNMNNIGDRYKQENNNNNNNSTTSDIDMREDVVGTFSFSQNGRVSDTIEWFGVKFNETS